MMKAQPTVVLIALASGLVSGLVVAMTLLYLPEPHVAADPPVRSRPTADPPAAGSGATPTADTPATQPMRSATTPTPAPHAQLRQYQATLQHLAQRLQRLESIRNVSQDAAEDGQAAVQTRAALTPEEGRAAELSWWEETQRRFEREAVDTPWAAATTPLFAADMAGLGEASGFAPVHTACRATQCVAVLEWPSYGEAVQGYATLLHHPYQANCARHTLLPAPDSAEVEQPYPMTIVFDCSEWRQQG